MKKLVFLFVLAGAAVLAQAQTLNFQLGDATFEATLTDMNATAKADVGGFQGELQIDFGLAPTVQTQIMTQNALQPAELYLAASLAATSKKTVPEVVVIYSKNKAKGWGFVATSLGIKPGSDAFKALKGKAETKQKKLKEKKGKPEDKGKH